MKQTVFGKPYAMNRAYIQCNKVDLEASGLCLLLWLHQDVPARSAPPQFFDPQVYPLRLQTLDGICLILQLLQALLHGGGFIQTDNTHQLLQVLSVLHNLDRRDIMSNIVALLSLVVGGGDVTK